MFFVLSWYNEISQLLPPMKKSHWLPPVKIHYSPPENILATPLSEIDKNSG